MIAWRTFACTVAALGLLTFTNCGDDEMATSGLSAGSAGGPGSSGESSGASSGSSGSSSAGTSDVTSAGSDTATTGSPTTGPGTTGPGTTGPGTTTNDTTGGSGANCGNGKIDPNEQCDGANLNGFDCTSLGNAGGTLACDPVTCTFDTSMCDGGGGGTSG